MIMTSIAPSAKAFDPVGKDVVLVYRTDLLFDSFDNVPAVRPPEHHDNAADSLVRAIDHGSALTHRLTDLRLSNILHIHRCTVIGRENDIPNVVSIPDQTDTANDVLIRLLFEDIPSGVLVVLFDGRVDLFDSNPVFHESVRVDYDLILLEVPAERVDLVHPGMLFSKGLITHS
jgi:hypothetical protein